MTRRLNSNTCIYSAPNGAIELETPIRRQATKNDAEIVARGTRGHHPEGASSSKNWKELGLRAVVVPAGTKFVVQCAIDTVSLPAEPNTRTSAFLPLE